MNKFSLPNHNQQRSFSIKRKYRLYATTTQKLYIFLFYWWITKINNELRINVAHKLFIFFDFYKDKNLGHYYNLNNLESTIYYKEHVLSRIFKSSAATAAATCAANIDIGSTKSTQGVQPVEQLFIKIQLRITTFIFFVLIKSLVILLSLFNRRTKSFIFS